MVASLGALFYYFGGDADGAGGNFAEGGGEHVVVGWGGCLVWRGGQGGEVVGEEGFGVLVGGEEEGCSGGGADEAGADAAVDAAEAA